MPNLLPKCPAPRPTPTPHTPQPTHPPTHTPPKKNKNFGLSDLRLVSPRDGWPNQLAIAVSVGADDLIASARLYNSVQEATADLNYLYAATARKRFMHKDYVMSRDLAGDYASLAPVTPGDGGAGGGRARVGVMFGRESSGLTNEEVAMARKILVVDSDPNFAVLNLAQAVVVCCYELYQLWGGGGWGGEAAQQQQQRGGEATSGRQPASSCGGGQSDQSSFGAETAAATIFWGDGGTMQSSGPSEPGSRGGSMDSTDGSSSAPSMRTGPNFSRDGGSVSDGWGFSFSSTDDQRGNFDGLSMGSVSMDGSRWPQHAQHDAQHDAPQEAQQEAQQRAQQDASGSPSRPDLANVQELATIGDSEGYLQRLFTELEAAGYFEVETRKVHTQVGDDWGWVGGFVGIPLVSTCKSVCVLLSRIDAACLFAPLSIPSLNNSYAKSAQHPERAHH